MTEATRLGHNNPPDVFGAEPTPAELAMERGKKALEAATESFRKGGAKTQEEADAAGGLVAQVDAAHKELERIRKEEKKPHIDAGNAVQAKYGPIIRNLKDAAESLKDRRITPFLKGQLENKMAAEAEALKKAQEKQILADALEKQRNAGDFSAAFKADEAVQQAKDAQRLAEEAAKQKVGAKHGAAKRATSLRTFKTGRITDLTAFLANNLGEEDLIEACQKIANRRARSGEVCPGMEINETQKAV